MGSLYNPVGLERVIMCAAGTMATTPTHLVCFGSRDDSAGYTVEPFKTQMSRGRENRNKENHKITLTSKQVRLKDLEEILYLIKNGFDCQVVGEPESGAASGGIFNWVASGNQIGIDFVYRISDGVRNCDITLERADNYEISKAFVDAADSGSTLTPSIAAIANSGGNVRGENLTNLQAPFFYQIKVPNDTVLFDANQIVSRLLEISTISNKNENNVSRVIRLKVKQEVTLDSVRITDWMTYKNKALSPTILIREYMSDGTHYEEFSFGANVLSFSSSNKKGENEGYVKLTIQGEVTLNQLTFAYGATNGGVDLDDWLGGKLDLNS